MPLIWKELEAYPGYEVSSQGTVRRTYYGEGGQKKYKILKPYSLKHYLVVSPSVDGKQKKAYVHSLVCEAFYGPAPSDDHRAVILDRDKHPTASNVQWLTRQEVIDRLHAQGLPGLGGKPKGLTRQKAAPKAPKKAAAAKAKPMPKTAPKAQKQKKAAHKK